MELTSLPVWAQQLGALLVTIGTAIALTWSERRKRHDDPKTISGGGEREVVAASFIGTRQMDDATAVLRGIDTRLITICEHLEKINERAHEEEIRRRIWEEVRARTQSNRKEGHDDDGR